MLSVMIWLFLLASMCAAQLSSTGTINGTVVDSTDAAVPGAKVTITAVGTKR